MGALGNDGLAVPGRVDLAHELPFTLGILRIEPSTRQAIAHGNRQTLEPKVMQVLVGLARADGAVVSRDELIDWCWDGRIVGDDALNRVIGRIRSLATDLGDRSFAVETIPRVGYRLSVHHTPTKGAPRSARNPYSTTTNRRRLLTGGAGVAGAAALGSLLWTKPWRHRPSAEAAELFRRGDLAQRAGTADQSRQSVTYFENAVRIDPQYAQAWGALALAYTHNLEGYGEAEHASLPNRIRSAAAKALELDPGNPDAQVALACIKPFFRNWLESETELRRIGMQHPDHWLAHGRLGVCLYQTGRFADGAAEHLRLLEIDPMVVVPYCFAARAFAASGRLQEADTLLAKAIDRWPAHRALWFTKFDLLLYSGRPGAAAGFLANPETLPSGSDKSEVDFLRSIAEAVRTREPSAMAKAADRITVLLQSSIANTPFVVPMLALLGRTDTVFAVLDRYLLDRGPFGRPFPQRLYERRYTDMLFLPPMAEVRRDPRFSSLMNDIGLADYWRRTGTKPQVAEY